jgi:hypothetical protein
MMKIDIPDSQRVGAPPLWLFSCIPSHANTPVIVVVVVIVIVVVIGVVVVVVIVAVVVVYW